MKVLRAMEPQQRLELAGIIVAILAVIGILLFLGLTGGPDSAEVRVQEAICLVLEKHVPNRAPTMFEGECLILTGVVDRVYMTIEDYAAKIRRGE